MPVIIVSRHFAYLDRQSRKSFHFPSPALPGNAVLISRQACAVYKNGIIYYFCQPPGAGWPLSPMPQAVALAQQNNAKALPMEPLSFYYCQYFSLFRLWQFHAAAMLHDNLYTQLGINFSTAYHYFRFYFYAIAFRRAMMIAYRPLYEIDADDLMTILLYFDIDDLLLLTMTRQRIFDIIMRHYWCDDPVFIIYFHFHFPFHIILFFIYIYLLDDDVNHFRHSIDLIIIITYRFHAFIHHHDIIYRQPPPLTAKGPRLSRFTSSPHTTPRHHTPT